MPRYRTEVVPTRQHPASWAMQRLVPCSPLFDLLPGQIPWQYALSLPRHDLPTTKRTNRLRLILPFMAPSTSARLLQQRNQRRTRGYPHSAAGQALNRAASTIGLPSSRTVSKCSQRPTRTLPHTDIGVCKRANGEACTQDSVCCEQLAEFRGRTTPSGVRICCTKDDRLCSSNAECCSSRCVDSLCEEADLQRRAYIVSF